MGNYLEFSLKVLLNKYVLVSKTLEAKYTLANKYYVVIPKSELIQIRLLSAATDFQYSFLFLCFGSFLGLFLVEKIDLGRRELAGGNLLFEQSVHLGISTTLGFR